MSKQPSVRGCGRRFLRLHFMAFRGVFTPVLAKVEAILYGWRFARMLNSVGHLDFRPADSRCRVENMERETRLEPATSSLGN